MILQPLTYNLRAFANMNVIGVTGGIGSGKTAVTDEFNRLGITIIDADVAARTVVSNGKPALNKIAQKFGQNILLESGELNRAALRSIIFKDASQRKWLEALTHPLIRQEIILGLQAAKSPYVILASPLLLESGQNKLVDITLVVDVPVELQIERTTARDNNSPAQVEAIIQVQLPRQERLKRADNVIVNDKDLIHLHKEVAKFHHLFLTMSPINER
jgi:dephospho-CoA kinase